MSTIADLFKNFNPATLLADLGGSAIGAIAAMFGQAQQYKYNKRLQDDAQEFNANEAALNRNWQTLMNRENNQFNAAQSELAREWQEQYYLKYQSPAAMMSQYKDAGINPVLAAGHATNTPPSASSASAGSAPGGAAASSGINSVGQMDLIGSIASIMKLKAEINNINADTEGKKAAAGASNAEAAYKASLKSVTDAQLNLVNEQFRKVSAEASNEEYRKNILEIEKSLLDLQHEQELDEKEFKRKYGIYPNDSVGAMILKLADKFGSNFKDWLLNTMLGLQESVTLLDYTKQ